MQNVLKSVKFRLLSLRLMAHRLLTSSETKVRAITGAFVFVVFIFFMCYTLTNVPGVDNMNVSRNDVKNGLPESVSQNDDSPTVYKPSNSSGEPDLSFCIDKDIHLFFLVFSRPENTQVRKAIRKSWGMGFQPPKSKPNQKYRTLFIVTKENAYQDDDLMKEQKETKDILIGNFEDSPQNTANRVILTFKWLESIEYVCRPWFILKTTDKVFHNVPKTIKWLEKNALPPFNVYRGKILRNDIPNRNRKHPNHVPLDVYPHERFPDLIQGPVYLFSYDVILRLVAAVRKVNQIVIEDAYIGLLAQKAGILPKHEDNFNLVKKTSNDCVNIKLLFIYDVNPSDHLVLFKLIQKEDQLHHCRALEKEGL